VAVPELVYGPLVLRMLRRRDANDWVEQRLANEEWLRPWESTPPEQGWVTWADRHTVPGFHQLVRTQRSAARAGTQLPYALFVGGQLCGQINVSNVVRGAFNSAHLGYWVSRRVAGRGVMPTAVALVADHCFAIGLHRLEANIRPENAPSIRVAEKVGFSSEGMRRRYLAIDGDYRDHLGYVLLSEDLPGGVLSALVASGFALR
jgi:ribosomal-protein-alanine N-acetyltransferase